jgi:hypothetical protein
MEKDPASPTEEVRPEKSKTGCGCALLVVLVFAIIVMLKIPYYISGKRTGCDRQAAAETAKIAEAFGKLAKEAERLKIPWDEQTIGSVVSGAGLQYMVGPHYGWGGCSDDCRLLFRMIRDGGRWIIEGTALKGSMPSGPDSRYCYRRILSDGKELPVKPIKYVIDADDGMSHHWNTYPRKDDSGRKRCYGESMPWNRGKAERPAGIIKPNPGKCPECPASSFHDGIGWMLGH